MRLLVSLLLVLLAAAVIALATWPLSRKLGARNNDFLHNLVAGFACCVSVLFLGLLFEPSGLDEIAIPAAITALPIYGLGLRVRWWKAGLIALVPALLMAGSEWLAHALRGH